MKMPTLVEDTTRDPGVFSVYGGDGKYVGKVISDRQGWSWIRVEGNTTINNVHREPTLAKAIEVLTGVFPESGVMVK